MVLDALLGRFWALLIASDPVDPSLKHILLSLFWQNSAYTNALGRNGLPDDSVRDPGHPARPGD